MNLWLVSGGRFVAGGCWRPSLPCTLGSVTYTTENAQVVELPGDDMPDVIAERYDASSQTRRRPATAQELASAASARVDAKATADIDASAAVKAAIAYALALKLGRDLKASDAPAVQEAIAKAKVYYGFITTNGL